MSYNDLWKNYKTTKNKELKDKLIIDNIEIVKVIAGRLFNTYNSNVDYDDLVSYGILGLIDAIEKFDPDKNVKFETYANFRIRGAIIDQLRSLDWVPRSTRQKYKKLEEVMQNLQNRYGVNIKDSILAEELGISIKELNDFLSEVSIFSIISLDEKLSENTNFNIQSKDPESNPETSFVKKESNEILKEIIKTLPEREKTIISLYYYNELTYKEIASILDISESRVSQLHTKCLLKLKNSLLKTYL